MLIAFVVAQATPDPLSGAGWVGAGLLGAVLSWLMFRYLPAKDQQISKIIETKDGQFDSLLKSQELEREKDRSERHDRNNAFQKSINDLYVQHSVEAEKDRQAFLQRSENVRMAIEKQTLELERAIKSSCMYHANQVAQGKDNE